MVVGKLEQRLAERLEVVRFLLAAGLARPLAAHRLRPPRAVAGRRRRPGASDQRRSGIGESARGLRERGVGIIVGLSCPARHSSSAPRALPLVFPPCPSLLPPSRRHRLRLFARAVPRLRRDLPRQREVARRERRRRRSLRRRRPLGLGAQGRDRERRAQPRQVDQRHGLRRPASRQRQHLRFLARRARADGARGARHRPLHRRRSGGGPARRGRPRRPTPRRARPRSVPSVGDRRRAGDRHRAGAARRRRSASTAHHQLRRRRRVGAAVRTSMPATRAASVLAMRARAIRFRWRRSHRCRARRRRHAGDAWYTSMRSPGRELPRRKRSGATPPSGRWRG